MAEQDEHTAKMQRLKASVDRRIEAARRVNPLVDDAGLERERGRNVNGHDSGAECS